VVSIPDEYGETILLRRAHDLARQTLLGMRMSKRHEMNCGEGGYHVLVTGHNLDERRPCSATR
jgi:hypothetical protein